MRYDLRIESAGALLVAAILLGMGPPPESPVADAAMRGDADAVRTLLMEGADVNAAQGDGMTALHWAAQNGDAELAQLLIYAGANVDVKTRIGDYQPLHLASESGNGEVVELLLAAGGDPNAKLRNGTTPLHMAAASGSVAAVVALLDRGANVNAREGAWGQTPLIFAAAENRAKAIRVLLERGADPNFTAWAVNVRRRAVADSAANERMSAVFEHFKEKGDGGADWLPSVSEVQAAAQEVRQVQRAWLNGKEVDQSSQAKAGEIADEESVDQSSQTKPGETTSEESEVQDESAREAEGESTEPKPLSYAELVGDWGGLTPLLHAVRQGNVDATLTLLDGRADINQPSAGDHTTPLLIAAINGQFDIAMLLLERGADPNMANDAGTTPLYAALERQWAPVASRSHPTEQLYQEVTYLQFMEALLKAGADPNVRLKKHLWYMQYTFDLLNRIDFKTVGATPFWRAAWALDVDAMQLLVAYGADPGIPTKKPPEAPEDSSSTDEDKGEDEDLSGLPPIPVGGPAMYPIHAATGVGYGQGYVGNLHRYAPEGWLPAVKYLVEEHGADVNARDQNGYTPLHHAAARGDNEMILYLIEKGADVTALSREGQTVADMANGPVQRVSPFPETVELLESLGSKNNHNCQSC